jgi:SAM-dependent methyltransferase
VAFDLTQARATGVLGFVLEAALGSVFVGATLAVAGGLLSLVIARAFGARDSTAAPPPDALEQAIGRTVARYGTAPLGVRYYVAGKLAADPAVPELARLGPLGRVLDAGSGRGQFGLLLLELGRLDSLTGFDSDARKVRFSVAAARGEAHFSEQDLAHVTTFDADTVLLLDVLHYLTLAEQTALFQHISSSSGVSRLVIRELDARGGSASRWTRFAEWIATRTGYNRATRPLCYRSTAELERELEGLGWQCRTRAASRGTPFGNVLTVATRDAR